MQSVALRDAGVLDVNGSLVRCGALVALGSLIRGGALVFPGSLDALGALGHFGSLTAGGALSVVVAHSGVMVLSDHLVYIGQFGGVR